MAAIAEQSESVISAALFGALAGSGALPFPRDAYEAAIRATGLGVEAWLPEMPKSLMNNDLCVNYSPTTN